MYISENDLKARILAGQLEILDDVLNRLRKDHEFFTLHGGKSIANCLQPIMIEYSKYRTELAREKKELETRG